MDSNNNILIADFIANKSNIDGLILSSKNDCDYLRILLDLNNKHINYFNDLVSFLNATVKLDTFCFINIDDHTTIDEETSAELFRKIRSKSKVIFYNQLLSALKFEKLFTLMNWMRLIKIEDLTYFGLPKSTAVLLHAHGNTKLKNSDSIFFNNNIEMNENLISHFYFPLSTTSFESSFLESINSEKSINKKYIEVTNLKINGVDRISEKGYSLGRIDLKEFIY